MNNFNGHYFQANQCINCECSIYPCQTDLKSFLCQDIINLSNSHKWKLTLQDKFYFDDEYECEICGLIGMTSGRLISPFLNEFYTCNEWLMIKANE